MSDSPPVIPPQFQIYECVDYPFVGFCLLSITNKIISSYVEDPKWQRRYTEIWAGCLCLTVVLSLPTLFRALRAGRVFTDLFGVWEGRSYMPVPTTHRREVSSAPKHSWTLGFLSSFRPLLLWSPLGVGLNLGQSTLSGLQCFLTVLKTSDQLSSW
jgi:hypothetical protein